MAIQYTEAGVTNLSFTVPTSGSYNLTAHWNVSATFTYNLSAGATSSGGTFLADYRIVPVFCVFDKTTSTGGCSSARPFQAAYVPPSNGSRSINATVPVQFNTVHLLRHVPLVAGDSYYLRIFLLSHVQADSALGLTTGSAVAYLDVAAPQNGATLVASKVYQ